MHRRDVDDPPASALLDHLPRSELDAEKGALEIDRKDPIVLGLGRLEDGGSGLNSGIVHHNVEASELRNCSIDEALQFVDPAHIRIDADRLIAE